ncbi:MAG: heme-copper oxidase subunit III [Myxococcota bacterium]
MAEVVRPPQFAPRPRPPVVPSPVLGTLIFVLAEAMLFAGLISAHMIVRSSAITAWPPPGQPRLPVEETAFNTAALLLSGLLLYLAGVSFERDPARARRPLLASILLGAFFVLFQGLEWVALLGEGLRMTTSQHASFFYLIVGGHALHAIGGLVVLLRAWLLLGRRRLRASTLAAVRVFWYFVVGLWPILYLLVYL